MTDSAGLRHVTTLRFTTGVLVFLSPCLPAVAQWPQWGGPNRDFTVETSGLAERWPNGGPAKLWKRELGDGFSAIVCDDGLLFTMYRRERLDPQEYTVALDARTGKTVWEHAHPAPLDDPVPEWGAGPNSTPLVTGELVCSIGARSVLHCFDKRTGKVVWRRDLAADFGAVTQEPGYACSPIAYKNLIIVPMGRDIRDLREAQLPDNELLQKIRERSQGRSLAAFDRHTGDVVWQSHDFEYGFSSPILIEFDGKPQIVLLRLGGLIGVDPEDGALLWQRVSGPRGDYYMTPLWNGRDRLFYAAMGEAPGGWSIRLVRRGGQIVPEEEWFSRKVQFSMGTPLRIGDILVGSRGGEAALVLAVNRQTGKRKWVQRGLGDATFVYGDGKIIFLDENGKLGLATIQSDGMTIHSESQVTERWSLTVPTLVGKTLYVRDRKHILALDLG